METQNLAIKYRQMLVEVTKDRVNIQKERQRLLNLGIDAERIKGLKLIIPLQGIICLQDMLINYVAILEDTSISKLRDEFDFTY
jgi:hypothetical protein